MDNSRLILPFRFNALYSMVHISRFTPHASPLKLHPILCFISVLLLTILCLLSLPTPALADNPTFNEVRAIGLGNHGVTGLAMGDLNGDGALDIVLGSYSRDLIFLNDGQGNFTTPTDLNPNSPIGPISSVAVGDLDGNGTLDIVLGNYYNENYENQGNIVYYNDGTGNFTSSNFGTGTDKTSSLAIGDIDGNGSLDIVVGNDGEQNVVYLNDGTGSFNNPPIPFSSGEDKTHNVALGDVDNNGALDIVVGNINEQNVVYLNDGAGNFYSRPVTCSSPPPNLPSFRCFGPSTDVTTSVAVGDLDGDGALDIVAGNGFFRNIPVLDKQDVVYLNDGTGNFYNGPVTCSSPPPDSPSFRCFGTGIDNTTSIAIGDLNSDHALDILMGNEFEQSVVYLNDGGGSFTQTISFSDSANTEGVVIADLDDNGALDLVLGNTTYQSVAYLSNGGGTFATSNECDSLSKQVRCFGTDENISNIVVGDVDGNQTLDLIAANFGQQDAIYLNDGITPLTFTEVSFGSGIDYTQDIAAGDLNGDNQLDLVVGNSGNVISGTQGLDFFGEQNVIYLSNEAEPLTFTPKNFGPGDDITRGVALGDMDGNGTLDIIVGNGGFLSVQQNVVYLNDGAGNFYSGPITCSSPPPNLPSFRCFGPSTDVTTSVAVGDLDGDGALDIVAGNINELNAVYLNDGAGNFSTSFQFGTNTNPTYSVALGDLNSDGSLDIVIGNQFTQNLIYFNNGAGNFNSPIPFGTSSDRTLSVMVSDINNDGALDIVVGNFSEQSVAYLNDGMGNFSKSIKFGTAENGTHTIAVGDLDGNGLLDIVVGSSTGSGRGAQNFVYLNGIRQGIGLTNHAPYITIARPVPTGNANFYSSPVILDSSTIPISYTLFDQEGDRVGRVAAFYSLDGGDNWQPAVATNTVTANLPASPTGTSYIYQWDTFASGVFGQSDNVVIRMVAYPQPPTGAITGTYRYTHTVAGPYQWPYAAAATFPFRVRSTQVQVISGTQGISNALVYRLPNGHSEGGMPLADGTDHPLRTNSQGYLQGRGQINLGDQLLALVPAPLPPTYTERYSDSLRLYYTNGTPTPVGVDAWISNTNSLAITQSGVQQLAVSPANSLLLFDLKMSLEWDASNDPTYLNQLEFDLKRASQFLYDFSNGQAALGQIIVYQDGQGAETADVIIQATNRLRPFANQGGVVATPTVDPDRPNLIYLPGQVTMGATWNRYGNAGQNLGQDWPLALAHELSHYFFFLDDVYMGFDDQDLLIPIDTCTGSVMGDMYSPSGLNTEFVDDDAWLPNCADTLTHKIIGRSEWATLKLWYPWLNRPAMLNPGPSLMPFDLTTVSFVPLTPTNTLADPTFYLDYSSGAISSSAGQGILLRDTNGDTDYDLIIDLGSPAGGQNRLLARGARPGDRLCAFDSPRRQFGCEIVDPADERLTLRYDDRWAPFIELSPVSSTTFKLKVSGLPLTFTLKAKLYPEPGSPSEEIELTLIDDVYQGQFSRLSQPALAGHVQVWVEEPYTESNPRREAIVAFSIGGNPPKSRGANAPVVSPDGQMIFMTRNPVILPEGQFYSIQSLAALPLLPQDKRAIGPGYNLLATAGVSNSLLTGSISFQYLGLDALTEGVNESGENTLTIHFWDGTNWQALPTQRNTTYNFASARSQGKGVYALLASISTPVITTFTPSVVTNDITTTLVITGEKFLPPVKVRLVSSATYTLPAVLSNPMLVTATITPGSGLMAEEYRLEVINGDGGSAVAPGTLSVFNADPSACFYDLFQSGANQWERSGDWKIVTLPNSSERAITDSPAGPYKGANDYVIGALTYTTAITSPGFSLANCSQPTLTFRHDYAIVGEDKARVEISTDNEVNWVELVNYGNSDLSDLAVQADGLEWAHVSWKLVRIDLSHYIGAGSIRLRFSLEVDQDVSAKGWVLDNITVRGGAKASTSIFLPAVLSQ